MLATCLAFKWEEDLPNDTELVAGGSGEGCHRGQPSLCFLHSFDQATDSGKAHLWHWLASQSLAVWCADPTVFLWTTNSLIIRDEFNLSCLLTR